MTKNQKLELTWIGKENRQHDRAPGESVRHRAGISQVATALWMRHADLDWEKLRADHATLLH